MTDSKPPVEKPSEMETLVKTYKENIQKIESRVAYLENTIPKLEKEKEQLIGMLTIMRGVVGENSTNGENDGDKDGRKE